VRYSEESRRGARGLPMISRPDPRDLAGNIPRELRRNGRQPAICSPDLLPRHDFPLVRIPPLDEIRASSQFGDAQRSPLNRLRLDILHRDVPPRRPRTGDPQACTLVARQAHHAQRLVTGRRHRAQPPGRPRHFGREPRDRPMVVIQIAFVNIIPVPMADRAGKPGQC